MTSALVIFYIVVALALIVLVLLQDPKGGGGALFGGGGSQSLFGATGATSFIVKATRFIAVLFALCVVGLNYNFMNNKSATSINPDVELSEPVLGGAAAETTDSTTPQDKETKKEEDPSQTDGE